MNHQTIYVFEHQTLRVGDHGFTESHRQALECFLGDKDEISFPYYSLIHNGVKFRHFVGVLHVNGLNIEVLPKTDRDNRSENVRKDFWRRSLLHMLSNVYKLDVKAPTDTDQQSKASSPILDVFVFRFLDEIDNLLNRGLVKCYHKIKGDRNALKGKLLLAEQLRRNFIHRERFYVDYTTYDYEHLMNCLLRQALVVSTQVTNNAFLRGRALSTLFSFPELKDVPISIELFDGLLFDRKTEDYQMAIRLAKFLLLNSMPNRLGNGDRVLALMFDMNKLWEEYVYIMLRRNLSNYEVRSQEYKVFWMYQDKTNKKHVIPDLVIRDKETREVAAILDTKWKCPANTPSDGDLHQMFVYSHMFNTNKIGLVYPSTNAQHPVNAVYLDQNDSISSRCCDMLYLSPFLDHNQLSTITNWIDPEKT